MQDNSLTSVASAEAATVTPENLPAITYRGSRVLTTAILAALYGTEEIRIQQNYAENKERFIEGKHFYKLDGANLKQFKELNYLAKNELVEISKHAKHLTLWTERGAARHAKILETDAAWDVFERLEDAYFSPREQRRPRREQGELFDLPPDPAALTRTFSQYLKLGKLAGLDPDAALRMADTRTRQALGVSPLEVAAVPITPARSSFALADPPPGPAYLTMSEALLRCQSALTAMEANKALERIGYLERRVLDLPGKPSRRYPVLIGEGLRFGENVKYRESHLHTAPLYLPERFPELLQRIDPALQQLASEVTEEIAAKPVCKMSKRQRAAFHDSGLAEQRKDERSERRRAEKRAAVEKAAADGISWGNVIRTHNLQRYFTPEEVRALKVEFYPRQDPPPSTLAAPRLLSFAETIDPAARADYAERNAYWPATQEQARVFSLEEAQRFLDDGDDWASFCFVRSKVLAFAFSASELWRLKRLYLAAFPTGETINPAGLMN